MHDRRAGRGAASDRRVASALRGARRTLRYWALWAAIGWLLVAVVGYLSLTPAPPEMGFRMGDKLGHLMAYAVLMGWFAQLYRTLRAHLALAAAFIGMGVALEFLQGWTGYRTLDGLDMVANSLGVMVAWVLARTRLAAGLQSVERRLLQES